MKVLFFSSVTGVLETRLLNLVTSLVPPEDVETYQEIPAVDRRLRQPHADILIAVLVVSDRHELNLLRGMREMLFDLHLLLLLPEKDRDEGAIAVAHSLRPRFIGFTNNNLAILSGVLRKTLNSKWGRRMLRSDVPGVHGHPASTRQVGGMSE